MRKGVSNKVYRRGGLREQYLTLSAKRPLTPSDIQRLEILAALLMHERAKNAR